MKQRLRHRYMVMVMVMVYRGGKGESESTTVNMKEQIYKIQSPSANRKQHNVIYFHTSSVSMCFVASRRAEEALGKPMSACPVVPFGEGC